MRDHALSEHKTLKDILSDIDTMTVTSPGLGFGDKLHILMVVSAPAARCWSPLDTLCWKCKFCWSIQIPHPYMYAVAVY
jgi:hypothetical protein